MRVGERVDSLRAVLCVESDDRVERGIPRSSRDASRIRAEIRAPNAEPGALRERTIPGALRRSAHAQRYFRFETRFKNSRSLRESEFIPSRWIFSRS